MMRKQVDLSPYNGLWVALVNGQVAGVGETAVQAEKAAQRQRPKDRVTVQFVEPADSPMLALSPLLAQLRPLFAQLDTVVYLVGGAVRDGVLGRVSHDLDFAVPNKAIKLAFSVADRLGVPAYVLDRERDTGRVVLADTYLDFARFRGEDLEADLRDRDFTINAMALPAVAQTEASLIDPCGGLADLKAGVITLTQAKALQQDPLRALRAVRQSLSMGLTLMPATKTAVMAASHTLGTVSIERVRDELLKLLQTARPHEGIEQMNGLGLLAVVLPHIAALVDVPQSRPHHEPVLAHTVNVLRWLTEIEVAVGGVAVAGTPVKGEGVAAPLLEVQARLAVFADPLRAHWQDEVDGGVNGRMLLRLGALFHDVGKRETLTETLVEGKKRYRFLGHEVVGAALTTNDLHKLCLSNQAVAHVGRIVRAHMRPFSLAEAQGARPSRRAIYRFFRDSKVAGLDVCLIALADHLATYDGIGEAAKWQRLVTLVETLMRHYFEHYEETVAPKPLINGHLLMAQMALPPGPEIGRLLRLIEEAQAAGEITTREEALLYAEKCRQ